VKEVEGERNTGKISIQREGGEKEKNGREREREIKNNFYLF
jgi:hypothetical protein